MEPEGPKAERSKDQGRGAKGSKGRKEQGPRQRGQRVQGPRSKAQGPKSSVLGGGFGVLRPAQAACDCTLQTMRMRGKCNYPLILRAYR